MCGPPPLSNEDDIAIVFSACKNRRALVRGGEKGPTWRYLIEVWQSSFARLQEAVVEHIEANRRVYEKIGDEGQPIGMQANVTLAEGLDIYVEMHITGGQVVILAAHSHYTALRLPQ